MSSTITTNMNLVVPTAGSQPGPDFALNINADMEIIDSHDHTPGKGVGISTAALDINADLSFNNFFATNLAGMSLSSQNSTPANGTVYMTGNDLYFVDNVGNNIRLTQNGSIVGTAGSISNLISPASASYVPSSSTFVWQSSTNIAANMDFGSAIFRNLSPNSTYGITMSAPSGLSSNYTLTLPTLPASQKFMTLDSSGNITAPWSVDNTTIQVTGNQLVVQPAANVQKEHAWELNGLYAGLTYPLTDIDSIFIAPANLTITSVWIYNGYPGVSGNTEFDLKVGTSGGSYTSILSTTGIISATASAAVWTDSGSIIGAQTGVQKPVLSTTNITAGQGIRFDLLSAQTGSNARDARIRIFYRLQ